MLNIAFSLSENNEIHLSIYTINGQLVQTIDQGKKTPGSYNYHIDLTNKNNGVYFLTLKMKTKEYSRKIIKNP
jgi:flagellar hook assembly protein FlgD